MVCFVPGCKSGNTSREKVHLMRISKNASNETRKVWLQNIPKQKGKTFHFKNNHLCHKHFEDRFIIKKNSVMLGSEEVSSEPRLRWKLTDDAIPTVFSNDKVPKYFDRKASVRPPPRTRKSEFTTTSSGATVEDGFDFQSQPASLQTISIYDQLQENSCPVCLPPHWVCFKSVSCIQYCKLIRDERELVPTYHSERTLSVFKNQLPVVRIRHLALDAMGKNLQSVEEISALLKHVDDIPICVGIQNINMFSTFENAYRCGNSWIATDCIQRLEEDGKVCNTCCEIRIQMRKNAESNIQGRKNLCPQKRKLVQCKKKHQILSRAMRRIRCRVAGLRASAKIMQRKFLNLEKTSLECAINEEPNMSPQMRVALMTAAKSAKAKSKFGMRYQSDWILQSILLKICSPKAYRHLRDNCVLPLPHPRYLTSLLRGIPCQFGFNDFVFDNLEKEFRGKPKKDRQFMLLFDEMKIREAISYNKIDMRFSGYIDYGDFKLDTKARKAKRLEADHALVFMCRSLNSKLTQPIASFETRGSAPGTILAKMIISCIAKLENIGCEIVGVISDGAPTNKSAWKILGITGGVGFVNNKISNPHDETRSVHFLCDIPHVVKCIRNHILKEGAVKFSGTFVNWGFYKALYDADKKHDIRVAPKLTYQHVQPNPFQKMVVSYATQIFSKSVADALQFYRTSLESMEFKNSEGTEVFTRKINDLFDACNARLPREGVRKNSKSYETIREFLDLLSSEDTFASSVTLVSIRVTLKSILDLTEYLCDVVGFNYVLTAKFNQDCLENFFGLVRSFGGDDCHPTATSFSHLFRLLSIYMPISKTLKGNIRVDEDYSVVSYMETLKDLKKSAQLKTQQIKQDIDGEILTKIVCLQHGGSENGDTAKNISQMSSLRYIAYYLCGFLVFKAKTFTACGNCLSGLEDPNPTTSDCMLTRIKEISHLRYPCKALFELILYNVEPTVTKILENEQHRLSRCVMSEVASNLSEINCAGIGCSMEHSFPLVICLVKYYITIRMFFFSKNQNKESLSSNTETKKKMKEAKLS